jgi:PIN domain nuclease of toxin-antitoxin system
VKYLLDTNVVIWLSIDLARIPKSVLHSLEDRENELYISTVSFWELTIKQTLGKLDGTIRFDHASERHGIQELPVNSRFMTALRELPLLHGDPFDRMLVAQAITDGLTLVTADSRLAAYPVSILRV